MWIPRLPGFAEHSGSTLARPERVETASGFGGTLVKADPRFGGGEHPDDEAAAQRELANLLAALEVGHLEATHLEAKAGTRPGTNRRWVESLKAFLRKWMGLPHLQADGEASSLNVLLYSLPLEYRNLLFRVHPDLRSALQAEQAWLLHRRFL